MGGGSPVIQGGMTEAEFQAQLDKQNANYEALIEKSNYESQKAEEARRKADEEQAAKDIQKQAAETGAINKAQDALAAELAASKKEKTKQEKQDIQSSYDALLSSFVTGAATNASAN